MRPAATTETVTLLLLRHAHVEGHRGDVPITDEGHRQARRAGEWISANGFQVGAVLYGGTRRTRETAEGILAGLGAGRSASDASDCFALRNPDLYLGGDRVSMVSSAEAFAEQTNNLTADDVTRVPFFREWLGHPERVGFWVAHQSPPGDTAASVSQRISAFAASLADVPAWRGKTVVAVTHSPVLRAVGLQAHGLDRGEPELVTGYQLSVSPGSVDIEDVAPATS
jgi:broad specificity phosphatase PhoE